jgi:hypothetical protein
MKSEVTVTSDPVIDELHCVRQQIAEKFGNDIDRILEDARQRQQSGGRPTWRGPLSKTALSPAGRKPTS